jgi:signal recognition particle subunit SRP54
VFDTLSDRLRRTLANLTGRGRVSEADVDVAAREIRLALLEADVNFKVVKDVVGRIREKAVGTEILGSLSAGQQIVKIVNDELVELLSAGDRTFKLQGNPAVISRPRSSCSWACRGRARPRPPPSSPATS